MRAQIRILIWIQPMRYAKSCQKVFKMLINDFVKFILRVLYVSIGMETKPDMTPPPLPPPFTTTPHPSADDR